MQDVTGEQGDKLWSNLDIAQLAHDYTLISTGNQRLPYVRHSDCVLWLKKVRDHYEAQLATLTADREGTVTPDWSQAPEWAEWWAVDADGQVLWLTKQPFILGAGWANPGGVTRRAESINLPLGVDWRTTLQRRPRAQGQETHDE